MYFTYFPLLNYTLDDGVSYQAIQDIFRRVVISYEYKTKRTAVHKYVVKDGETPEMLSDKFYRSTKFHWLILHANEILDARFDWPLSTQNLILYCKGKYGDNALYDIHHWEWIINEDTTAEMRLINDIETSDYSTSISNWEYEEELNDAKREINIFLPEIIPALTTEFQKIIK